MAYDYATLVRLAQRTLRSGTNITIETYYKDTGVVVDTFTITGAPLAGPVPYVVTAMSEARINILSGAAFDPNAMATALGSATVPITAQVVPRTDTRANLLALSGNAGELSSATDYPTVVKHTGTAGGAVAFDSFGSTQHISGQTPANGSTVVLPSWAERVVYATNVADTRSATIEVAAGKTVGQRLYVTYAGNYGAGSCTLTWNTSVVGDVTPTGALMSNTEYLLVWSGALWTVAEMRASDALGFSYAGGKVFSGGVGIGLGASSEHAKAVCLSASATAASGSDGDTLISSGVKRIDISNQLYTTTVNSVAQAELTLDGAAASAANRFAFAIQEGRCKATITVFGQIGTGDEMWCNTYTVLLDLSTVGSISLASAVVSGTAIPGLTTTNIGTPTVAIGVSSGKLTVKVTPAASSSASTVKWWAAIDVLKLTN